MDNNKMNNQDNNKTNNQIDDYTKKGQAGDDAEKYCEKARCLFERAKSQTEQAKCLYSQAMSCDEKAMNCYKAVGEKIKEYENKSKKCEDMMNKCQEKIAGCHEMEPCKPKKSCYVDLGMEEHCKPKKKSCYMDLGMEEHCKPKKKSCYVDLGMEEHCKPKKAKCMCDVKYVSPAKSEMKPSCGCEYNWGYEHHEDEYCNLDDIMLIKEEETGLYINPIYNMEPMQHMGHFANKYPSMEEPYMCIDNMEMDETHDMWMNYYMYMQNMMKNMMYN